jgi:hypothetical protein
MKAYALGIIAVLSLSIGYSAYRNAEANREEALAVARDIPETVITPTFGKREADIEVPEMASAMFASELDDRGARPRVHAAGNAVKAQAAGKEVIARKASRLPSRDAGIPAFATTVIYYKEPDRSLLADTGLESRVLAGREERRKNRSLLSKTFSVVKKPYEWLKTVAAKLD